MNSVLQELYDAAGLERERVYEAVVVGNARCCTCCSY